LKEVAATLLPKEIIERRKQGFGVPIGVWFRGSLRELFADTLLASRTLQRGYFQPGFVQLLVDEHLSGKRDHTLRLWQLLVFEKWHQQYVDASSTTAIDPVVAGITAPPAIEHVVGLPHSGPPLPLGARGLAK
jgi:asparagine synthase (glutamine-hydrolysing)